MNANEIVRELGHRADAANKRGYSGEASEWLELADLIEYLQAQLAEAQRRERAAVEDLNLTANCDVCKHYDADENSCAKPTVDSYSCFEWRGTEGKA